MSELEPRDGESHEDLVKRLEEEAAQKEAAWRLRKVEEAKLYVEAGLQAQALMEEQEAMQDRRDKKIAEQLPLELVGHKVKVWTSGQEAGRGKVEKMTSAYFSFHSEDTGKTIYVTWPAGPVIRDEES